MHLLKLIKTSDRRGWSTAKIQSTSGSKMWSEGILMVMGGSITAFKDGRNTLKGDNTALPGG
jgi:hypothetical protein